MSFVEVESSTVGEGTIVRLDRVVMRAPDGSEHVRDVVRHPGGVGVLVIDRGRVSLLRQYRVAVGRQLLEIPAGKRDDPDGDPLDEAKRELAEEMGMTAAEWVLLGSMEASPGYTSEVLHLYAASGIVAAGRRPDGAEEHEAEIVEMSLDDALASLDDGTITDAKTQIALLRWARRNR